MQENSPLMNNTPLEKKPVSSFETAKGSTYTYMPDGTTKRFKKAENKEYDPQDLIVFVPDWQTLTEKATPENLLALGNTEDEYNQLLLDYSQNKKIFVMDDKGNKLNTNKEAASANRAFIALCKDSESVPDFIIPVSIVPKENYRPYDTKKYQEEGSTEKKRDQHIGNKITKLNYD